MKLRSWNTRRAVINDAGIVEYFDDGGTEEAAQVASALANVCDAGTLRSLLDCVVTLQRHGGEAYIGAYRSKVAANGRIIPPRDHPNYVEGDAGQPGTYETVGFLFYVDPVAKQTRQATEAPEEPEVDPDLRQPIPLIPESEGEEPEQIEDELAATG